MGDFLRKAFGLAVSAHHSITNAFDYVGYLSMRAVMDNQFLAVNTAEISSPPLKMAATAYEFVKTRAQSSVFNQLQVKLASGDLGPKPDIKPPIYRALGALAQNIPRLALSHSAMAALAIGTGIVAAHLLTNGQFTQSLTDAAAVWLGTSPHNKGPSAQP